MQSLRIVIAIFKVTSAMTEELLAFGAIASLSQERAAPVVGDPTKCITHGYYKSGKNI